MGASFTHVLELPAKLDLPGDRYLAVQEIYRYFGAVAAVLEIGSLVLMMGAIVLGWHRSSAHAMPVLALILFAASLATWALVVSPVNTLFVSWAGGLPAHWTGARDRWEWGHVAVFGLKLAAFVLLITALLRSR